MRLLSYALLPALLGFGLIHPALAAPALWEVSDADSSLWVFGSFHILPEGTEWRTELFDGVLAEADTVVFEADIRPAAATQLFADSVARGVYVDGTLLTDVIDAALEAQLRQRASTMSTPIGMMLAMRPWLVTTTITAEVMAANGLDAAGVEAMLLPDIADARLGFLETGTEQLDVLAGAPEEEQLAMLQATLAELDALPEQMRSMKASWLAGSPEQLLALFATEMGGFETAFLERLLYARNQNWLAPLATMLADNQENLVIVGAAHLVGTGSVLELLEQAGYRVQRVQ